jgi:uncharacterized protein (TIGR02246 family)
MDPRPSANDEQALRDVVATWHRATAAGDVDAVLALMTDDAVFLGAGRPPMVGRDAFGAALRALLATQRIASTGDVREAVVDGDLGYCWTHLTVETSQADGGGRSVRSGHTLSVFRRGADGRWRLARDANLLA